MSGLGIALLVAALVLAVVGLGLRGQSAYDRTLFCEQYLTANKGNVAEAQAQWSRSYPSQKPPRMTQAMEAWRLAWLAGVAAGKQEDLEH